MICELSMIYEAKAVRVQSDSEIIEQRAKRQLHRTTARKNFYIHTYLLPMCYVFTQRLRSVYVGSTQRLR